MVKVKICGLTDYENASVAEQSGAAMLGFVFFDKSPRALTPEQARSITQSLRGDAEIVALTVDADEASLDLIVSCLKPDWLQLHGQESPDRVKAIKTRYGRPVIKAFAIDKAADFAATKGYEAADLWLFDAKPSPQSDLPGGNGLTFDWKLMTNPAIPRHEVMLSGGLTADNVAHALRQAQPDYIDVSSGVEARRGHKHPELIRSFLEAVKTSDRERHRQ